MSRRDEYHRHLSSPEWQEQRQVAFCRTSGFCQFCGDFATQVHHVRYPKKVGEEHPDTLVPMCDRCHKLSHGIQPMEKLDAAKVAVLKDNAPTGMRLNYLVCEARVYASAESWIRALGVPRARQEWFRGMLANQAMLKKDSSGGALRAEHKNTPVYRWHAVEWTLRAFETQFLEHGFRALPPTARQELENFHRQCSKIFAWGQDLQERAITAALRKEAPPSVSAPLTQSQLVAVVREAIAPRLNDQDDKLREHDVVIQDHNVKIIEIRRSVPSLRNPDEFITVKQAAMEKGYDTNEVPLPHLGDNLSGLAGQLLKTKRAVQGPRVTSRQDGQSLRIGTATYKRGEIYSVLDEIILKRPAPLLLSE